MKPLVPLMVAALASGVAGWSAASAAETKSPPAAAASRGLEGRFEGRWQGADDASGQLRFNFKRAADAQWTAEASFTFEGQEFRTRTKSFRVEGTRIELVFEWSVDGNSAESKVTGELDGDKLQGRYETSGAAGETRGTWNVART